MVNDAEPTDVIEATIIGQQPLDSGEVHDLVLSDADSQDGGSQATPPQLPRTVTRQQSQLSFGVLPTVPPVFPESEYRSMHEDLCRKHPWVVKPGVVHSCIKTVIQMNMYYRLHGSSDQPSKRELNMIRQLFHEVVPSAIEKCFVDVHCRGWSALIQRDILICATYLLVYVKQQLVLGVSPEGFGMEPLFADDLERLLECCQCALDPNSTYHKLHLKETPSDQLPAPPWRWTHTPPHLTDDVSDPSEEGMVTSPTGSSRRTSSDSLEDVTVQCAWLRQLLEVWGERQGAGILGGFDLLVKVCAKVRKAAEADDVVEDIVWGLPHVSPLLLIMADVGVFLHPRALRLVIQGVQEALLLLQTLLDGDTLEMFDPGLLGMEPISTISLMLATCSRILKLAPDDLMQHQCNCQLTKIQMDLVQHLLHQDKFKSHLSAVREINCMLHRLEQDNTQGLFKVMEWLRSEKVVQRLLRNNLHHKQYVDQVQKILKFLSKQQCLQEEHLDLLWKVTEKADTFEVVKNNVYGMLGELALNFSASMLDALFLKFEKCKGWPVSDTLKLIELMRRFAESDAEAVMADRVLQLLWDLVMEPNAPSEIIKCGALQEVVSRYENISNQDYVTTYSQRCVEMIRSDNNVLAALHVLKELVAALTKADGMVTAGARSTVINRLEQQFHIVELVLSNLEALLAKQRARKAAANSAAAAAAAMHASKQDHHLAALIEAAASATSVGAGTPEGHDIAVKDYTDFLMYIGTGGRPLTWNQVKRVWISLVEQPSHASDRETGLQWLVQMLDRGGMQPGVGRKLLLEKFVRLHPQTMSLSGGLAFISFFWLVNEQEGKVEFNNQKAHGLAYQQNTSYLHAVLDPELLALDYLWQLVMNMDPELTSHLGAPYTTTGNAAVQCAQTSLAYVERLVHDWLLPACHVLGIQAQLASYPCTSSGRGVLAARSSVPLPLPDRLAAQQHLRRTTQQLLAVVRGLRSTSLPEQPAHMYSWQGAPVTMQVLLSPPLNGQARQMCMLSTHTYVGHLRQRIAELYGQESKYIRLICQGEELKDDALVVKDIKAVAANLSQCIPGPVSVNSMVSPKPVSALAAQTDNMTTSKLIGMMDLQHLLLACAKTAAALVPGVYSQLVELLNLLPSHRSTVEDMKRALQHPNVAQQLQMLLQTAAGEVNMPLFPLLYTTQCLTALLYPSAEPYLVPGGQTDTSGNPICTVSQCKFLTCGAPSVLFQEITNALSRLTTGPGTSLLQQAVWRQSMLSLIEVVSQLVTFFAATCGSAVALHQKLSGPPTVPNNVPQAQEAVGVAAARTSSGADDMLVPQAMDLATVDGLVPEAADTGGAPTQTLHTGLPPAGETVMPVSVGGNVPAQHSPVDEDTRELLVHLPQVVRCKHSVLKECLYMATTLATQLAKMPSDDALQALLYRNALSHTQLLLESLGVSRHLSAQGKEVILLRSLTRQALFSRSANIRNATHQFWMALMKQAVEWGPWLLSLLVGLLEAADSQGDVCQTYYQLLEPAITAGGGVVPGHLSEAFVQSLALGIKDSMSTLQQLAWSSGSGFGGGPPDHAQDAAKVDRVAATARLEGKMRCLSACAEHLSLSQALSKDSRMPLQELLDLLFNQLLFPEALAQRSMQSRRLSTELLKAGNELVSGDVRKAGLQLCSRLMMASEEAWEHCCQSVAALHMSHAVRQYVTEVQLPALRRSGNPVGLRNAGATCYLNAVFQQLFSQPVLRSLILSHKGRLHASSASADERTESLLYQVQEMFAHLALSNREQYEPEGVWRSYKDGDGHHINLREHQDAYEFFTRLQDQIDSALTADGGKAAMQVVLGGKFCQQVICRNVPFTSEQDQGFCGISVDVRGKRGLLDSLESYVQGELMEGDNQYYCEKFACKVDAVMRNCIKELPSTLLVHLKRFEWDYETMTRWKIRDRFEFPLRLDMWPYTKEGLAAQETAAQEGCDAPGPIDPEAYQYELHGVVVHSGTAFAGHYYSYIKDREGSGQLWRRFDDGDVSEWDVSKVEADCFGGQEMYETLDSNNRSVMQEYDRPNSAYMLVYERVGIAFRQTGDASPLAATSNTAVGPGPRSLTSADPLDSCPSLRAAMATGLTLATGSEATAGNTTNSTPGRNNGRAASGTPTSTLLLTDEGGAMFHQPVPLRMSDPSQQPATIAADDAVATAVAATLDAAFPYNMAEMLFMEVLTNNLVTIQHHHVYDTDYFDLLLKMMEQGYTRDGRGSSKIRRTGSSGHQGSLKVPSAASHPAAATDARAQDADHAALVAIQLATRFLLKVYITAPRGLRTTSRTSDLLTTFTSLMRSSARCCSWVAHYLLYLEEPHCPRPFSEPPEDPSLWSDETRFAHRDAAELNDVPKALRLRLALMMAQEDVRNLLQDILYHLTDATDNPKDASQHFAQQWVFALFRGLAAALGIAAGLPVKKYSPARVVNYMVALYEFAQTSPLHQETFLAVPSIMRLLALFVKKLVNRRTQPLVDELEATLKLLTTLMLSCEWPSISDADDTQCFPDVNPLWAQPMHLPSSTQHLPKAQRIDFERRKQLYMMDVDDKRDMLDENLVHSLVLDFVLYPHGVKDECRTEALQLVQFLQWNCERTSEQVAPAISQFLQDPSELGSNNTWPRQSHFVKELILGAPGDWGAGDRARWVWSGNCNAVNPQTDGTDEGVLKYMAEPGNNPLVVYYLMELYAALAGVGEEDVLPDDRMAANVNVVRETLRELMREERLSTYMQRALIAHQTEMTQVKDWPAVTQAWERCCSLVNPG